MPGSPASLAQLSDTEPSAVSIEAFECSSPLEGEPRDIAVAFPLPLPLLLLVEWLLLFAGGVPSGAPVLEGGFTPGDADFRVLFGVPGVGVDEPGVDFVATPDWFLCSAASALLMLSCFFHFVRRFWNQILTCNREKQIQHEYKSKGK